MAFSIGSPGQKFCFLSYVSMLLKSNPLLLYLCSWRCVFIRPHLKMWAYYAIPLSSVCPSVSLSVCPLDFVFVTPPKPFEGFWWNLVQRKITLCRCAYYKGTPVLLLPKELQPLDLAFSVKSTLSLQLLLNSLGDFDETWYKERSHCVDVHIIRGPLSNYFSGSYGLWT